MEEKVSLIKPEFLILKEMTIRISEIVTVMRNLDSVDIHLRNGTMMRTKRDKLEDINNILKSQVDIIH